MKTKRKNRRIICKRMGADELVRKEIVFHSPAPIRLPVVSFQSKGRHAKDPSQDCSRNWFLSAHPPRIRLPMTEEIPQPNPPLSAEEHSAAAKLTDADLQIIDAAILANSSNRRLKVARVVTATEDALRNRYPELSYLSYAQRLIRLAEEGRLESQGNLKHIRFSEVRTPA